MLLKLIPADTSLNFLGARKIALVLSSVLILASMALFAVKGLNYGIDFKGGIQIEVGDTTDIPIADVRSALAELDPGEVSVTAFGLPTVAMIVIERQPGESDAQLAMLGRAKEVLSSTLGDDISFRQENIIGPKVSGELKQDGTIAVLVAVALVLLYIWVRFEWQFGVGAVVALVHDVLLTIGFFAVTGLEFNLSTIAALLTIVGYSLNDTVVVYDRVRENIRRFRKMTFEDLLNLSLNNTLSRTVMTSVTTLLALVALFVFGGANIQGFTAAMIWGVLVGTYSSIFVASPLLLQFDIRREAFYADEDNDPTVDKSRGVSPFDQVP